MLQPPTSGLPGLAVERLEQTYLRTPGQATRQCFDYSAPAFDFSCRLVYDESGLVVEELSGDRRAGGLTGLRHAVSGIVRSWRKPRGHRAYERTFGRRRFRRMGADQALITAEKVVAWVRGPMREWANWVSQARRLLERGS